MEVPALIVMGVLVTGFLLWKAWDVCVRWGWLVLLGVLLIDGALVLATFAGGPGYLVLLVTWTLWLLYADTRWENTRGLLRLPRWPRATWMRGPRKKRRREFPEPMPWTRGPFTY